jgi:hypothetical protein
MAPFNPNIPLQTAILMVIFNRPETTRQVFDAIKKVKPLKLYIAADGPRKNKLGEAEKCAETRRIVDDVDWDCEVKTLFREENVNCGLGPSSAFTWFFEHEEEGIILEDDCLPTPSFFWFCQELLERYRNDHRIMHIGGNNFLNGWQNDTDYSYYFSQSGHIWGWASWRRAWKMFDYNIGLYDKLSKKNYFTRFFLNPLESLYRLRKFNKTVASARVDWWDYQWDFARYVNSGLAIVPRYNLVQNLGFGEGATHTQNGNSKSARMDVRDIEFPLKHPPFMIRDVASDKKYFKNFIKDVMLSKLPDTKFLFG